MVPDINLLPLVERKSTGTKWGTLLIAALFLGLLVFLTIQYISLTASAKTLQAEQLLLQAEKTEVETKVVSLEQPERIDLGAVVRTLEGVTYPVSPLLTELNHYRGTDVYFREFILADDEIEFVMDFETMPEAATYLGDLTGSIYFVDSKVNEVLTFDPMVEEKVRAVDSFDVVDRFSYRFTVTIDPYYVRNGGALR